MISLPQPGAHKESRLRRAAVHPPSSRLQPQFLELQGPAEARPPGGHQAGSPCWSKPDLPSPTLPHPGHHCQQGSPAHTCRGGLHSHPGPASSHPAHRPLSKATQAGTQVPVGWWKQEVATKVCDRQTFKWGRGTSPFILPAAHSGGWAGIPREPPTRSPA